MRLLRSLSIVMGGLLAACAAGDDALDLDTTSSAVTVPFYVKFDNYPSGNIDGQDGWVGNCVVTDDATPPNKYLKCRSGDNATKAMALQSSGSFYLQTDVWPNVNVVNSTHGKLSLEGPQGRVFQIIVGCDNIRVAFQMNGPVAGLMSFPCNTVAPPPRYRVICMWSGGGTTMTCGAAQLPAEVTSWVTLNVPSALRPFNSVALTTFALPGATLFDKIYLERN